MHLHPSRVSTTWWWWWWPSSLPRSLEASRNMMTESSRCLGGNAAEERRWRFLSRCEFCLFFYLSLASGKMWTTKKCTEKSEHNRSMIRVPGVITVYINMVTCIRDNLWGCPYKNEHCYVIFLMYIFDAVCLSLCPLGTPIFLTGVPVVITSWSFSNSKTIAENDSLAGKWFPRPFRP